MNIGDLVKIKSNVNEQTWDELRSQVGIVLDMYEDMSTTHYKVQYAHEYFWIDGFLLETVSINNNGEKNE
ncbi:MAG: hypothetical protein CL398_03310 [Acidiferrobacteraceae bacterium]|nr:hypothetical protein [Acidiferrobacteraceae bacterium]|tara:strand:- start:761 stop:970 length:210 start_codon:yes stop_codon:yes gene_type:complete